MSAFELEGGVEMVEMHTPQSEKNPISILNEICQKCRWSYCFEDEANGGKSHEPWFQLAVRLNGVRRFPAAEARSKQLARRAAAQLALDELTVSQQDAAELDVLEPQSSTASSSDVDELADDCADLQLSERTRQLLADSGKHPISLLMEFAQKRRLSQPAFNETDAPPAAFAFAVHFGDHSFAAAVCSTKKAARSQAAAIALNELVNAEQFSLDAPQLLPKRSISQIEMPPNPTMHDVIASEVIRLFRQTCEGNAEMLDSGKVVAAVVAVFGSTEAKVLSFASGNRCVKAEHMSTTGVVLNDCHAEVLARRGFLRYLYKQLFEYRCVGRTDLFEGFSERRRLLLKRGMTLHLFISTAPCGDGRVFCLAETAEATARANSGRLDEHEPWMSEPKKHGLLRTKIESGEGTIPVLECAGVQTLDGIAGGERLRTMSCSDKILKWNVLGLQGALLSNFFEPIYLSSIVLGNLFHRGHLARAACCRAGALAEANALTAGYRVAHPVLAKGGVQTNSARDISKSVAAAVNWNCVDQTVEVVDGTTGQRLRPRAASRLCKAEVNRIFKMVCAQLSLSHLVGTSYAASKQKATDYATNYATLRCFCAAQGYGNWLGKPREEKLFE